MKPVIVTLRQLHVPDRCGCQFHPRQTFIDSERVVVFSDAAFALETLADWNRQQKLGGSTLACWVYEIEKVQEAPLGTIVEFGR